MKEDLEYKIELIDQICERHPSLGVKKGWSDYTGGMKDSGEWHYRKMLDVGSQELLQFLQELETTEKIQENKPEPVYTEQELKDKATMVKIEFGNGGWCVTSQYEINQLEKFGREIERKLWFGEG